MKKIIFLIPPSEGKNSGGEFQKEALSYNFPKPLEIAINATEKDLKCKGERFKEGIKLNKKIKDRPFASAISRYSGVMFKAIDFIGMSENGKEFFNKNFLILSGMYGLVSPLDKIANYKLPIETKGLLKFWGEKITDELNSLNPDLIVNLLPASYLKMLNLKNLKPKLVNINFLTEKNGKIIKVAHGVKKLRGEWIKNICEKGIVDFKDFGANP